MSAADRRLTYLGLAAGTIAVGLWVHTRAASLSRDARDVLGDAIWAVMIVWLVGVVAPRARLVTRGLVAVGICFAVELSQLIHSPSIDALRATTLGSLVLGSGFDSRDLAAYAFGVAAALLFEGAIVARIQKQRR